MGVTSYPNIGSPDSDIEYVRGRVSGYEVVQIFGRNEAVGTSFEPVAIGGIYRTPQPASATQVRIKAGNANDTAAGSGARSVRIEGINASGALVSETLTTAGASASSNSTNSYIRLLSASVETSGTYASASAGSHAAAVVIENSAGTEDWLTIPNGNFALSQSEIGVYTVPTGKTAYVRGIVISTESNKSATIALFQRENILQASAPYSAMKVVNQYAGFSGSFQVPLKSPLGPFPENTDVGFMAKVASTAAIVSVNCELLLIDN